jgi:DNA-directed RNA polymerase specialized sigma24 family protein
VKVGAMSRTEVAKILELKPETVKFHLAEAMKRIRTFCMIHLHSIFIFAITFGDYFENISK